MPSKSTGTVDAGTVEPASVGRIWPPTWIYGKISSCSLPARGNAKSGVQFTNLLVARDVEVHSQGGDLGSVLGLPVVPELLLGQVGRSLDVGDHLRLPSV